MTTMPPDPDNPTRPSDVPPGAPMPPQPRPDPPPLVPPTVPPTQRPVPGVPLPIQARG